MFTRREVVDFILDLVGYTADRPLHQARILEPAVGQGDFLLPTIDRLMDAYARLPAPSGATLLPISATAFSPSNCTARAWTRHVAR